MSTRRPSVSFARPISLSELPTATSDPSAAEKALKVMDATHWLDQNLKAGSVVVFKDKPFVTHAFRHKQSPAADPFTHFSLAFADELVKLSQVDVRKALRFKEHDLFSSGLPFHASQAVTLMYHHSPQAYPLDIHSHKPTTSVIHLNHSLDFESSQNPTLISDSKTQMNHGPMLPKLPIHLRSYASQASARTLLNHRKKEIVAESLRESGHARDERSHAVLPDKQMLKISSVIERFLLLFESHAF